MKDLLSDVVNCKNISNLERKYFLVIRCIDMQTGIILINFQKNLKE